MKLDREYLAAISGKRVLVIGSGDIQQVKPEKFDTVWLLNYAENPFKELFSVRLALDFRVIRSYLSDASASIWSPALATKTERVVENLGYDGFSLDCSLGIFYGHTVAYAAMQILASTDAEHVTFTGVNLSYWKTGRDRVRREMMKDSLGAVSRLDLLPIQSEQLFRGDRVMRKQGIVTAWMR